MIQREIKFRAWNYRDRCMANDAFRLNSDGTAAFQWIMPKSASAANLGDGDIVWLQFTGLKDKNEKEIYEGDRLATESETFEVIFDQRAAAFRFVDVVGNSKSPLNYEQIEVIGNIYEDPELLPDEKVETNLKIKTMADYEAAPEGGIKEAGIEQAVPGAAPAEEAKPETTGAPEAEAEKNEETSDAEKSEEGEKSGEGSEGE